MIPNPVSRKPFLKKGLTAKNPVQEIHLFVVSNFEYQTKKEPLEGGSQGKTEG